MTRLTISEGERGAALLTVLLLVSVIAVIAATSLDRLRLSTRLTGNAGAMMQADAFLQSAEHVALSQAALLRAGGGAAPSLEDAAIGQPRTIPVDGGVMTVVLQDGSNCFNLNGLVRSAAAPDVGDVVGDSVGPYVADRSAMTIFSNLMQLVGIDANRASQITASAADWIDTDNTALPGGAEDTSYRNRNPAYLPPNGPMAHISELKAVEGMDAQSWDRIRPYVCALPDRAPAAINVNTLRPDQSVLLSMLSPDELPPATAKSILANRPTGGYGSLLRFWAMPGLAELDNRNELAKLTSVTSRYFLLEADVDYGGIMARELALIDASNERPWVVWRQERID